MTTRISKIQYLEEEEEEDHGIQDVWIRRQFGISLWFHLMMLN